VSPLLYVWAPFLAGVIGLALSENRRWEAMGIAVSGLSVALALMGRR